MKKSKLLFQKFCKRFFSNFVGKTSAKFIGEEIIFKEVFACFFSLYRGHF